MVRTTISIHGVPSSTGGVENLGALPPIRAEHAVGVYPMETPVRPASNESVRDYETSRHRNYLARHWRGELSLPVAFWVNGICTIITLNVLHALYLYVFYLVRDSDPIFASPESVLLQIAAFALFRLTVYAWLIVGIWRSASKGAEGTGGRLWGLVSKLVCVLLMAAVIKFEIDTEWPQLQTLAQYLSGDTEMGPHSIRVRPGGTEVEFSGAITLGSTQELRNVLDVNPVRTIDLNSQGGRLGEAEAMRRLISERKLNTYVSRECLSACTLAFLGGRERWLGLEGRIAFHRGGVEGETPEVAGRAADVFRKASVEAGANEAFIDMAVTAFPQLWYPSTDELLKARVMTSVGAPPENSGG
jgi:hypothetical protein